MQKELKFTKVSKMQLCDVFELIDDNGETYYYKLEKSYNSGAGWVKAGIQPSIILVSFFLNEKKLYENKKYFLIAGPYMTRFKNEVTNQWIEISKQLYGGEWSCEVSVLEKEEITKEVIEDGEKVSYVIEEGNLGTMSYIMKSESGEIISSTTVEYNEGKFCFVKNINDMKGKIDLRFISVEDYNSEKKLQKKQNDKTNIENNNLKFETINKLTSKYGKEKAFLISNGKVEIGMTRQMCVDSCGAPLYSKIVKTKNISKETLSYSLNKILYLENGILKKIEY